MPAVSGKKHRPRTSEGRRRPARLPLLQSQQQSRPQGRELEALATGKDGPWELYDLSKDRCEQHDLAAADPDRVRKMVAVWEKQDDEYVRVRESAAANREAANCRGLKTWDSAADARRCTPIRPKSFRIFAPICVHLPCICRPLFPFCQPPSALALSGTCSIFDTISPRSNEHHRALHPPPGHDSSAHAGHRAVRRRGLSPLPVSDLPNVDFPTIQVTASLPGASPETMAAVVATPLERQFSTIAGLDSMTSTSVARLDQITLQFNLDRTLDAAAQDVQAAIAAAARRLPRGMPDPPTFQKVNPADQPILYLVAQLADPAALRRRRVRRDADRAAHLDDQRRRPGERLRRAEIRRARAARPQPAGGARHRHRRSRAAPSQSTTSTCPPARCGARSQAFTVQANGQLFNAAAFRPLIVAYRNGAPVRLEELGRVIDSVQNDKVASWFNDRRSITLLVQRQPGTNTVEVVDGIKQLLPTFREQMPPSVNLDIVYDRSDLDPRVGR